MKQSVKTLGHSLEECEIPGCEVCRLKKQFELPPQLFEAVTSQNLVLFAGGGISTETKNAYKHTLYDEIHRELKLKRSETPSFPSLMTQYCARPNGRTQLLLRIKERIDYGHRFPEVLRSATAFHRELRTIPFINEIYTTNWDDYFESVCHATPFVSGDDFAFWNIPQRKVFKIHGSIRNLGSIVATTTDYNKCYRTLRSGLLGSQLKIALATKTVVFVGYSLRDDDFLRIWNLVRRELRELIPAAYWVTLSSDGVGRTLPGLIPIVTDGVNFLKTLKSKLVAEDLMVSDRNWVTVHRLLDKVSREHLQFSRNVSPSINPEAIYALVYQDGLIHACEWLLAQAKAGKASHECYIHSAAAQYEQLRSDFLSAKRFADVAYVEGFLNGLVFAISSHKERRSLPLYFVFGAKEDLTTLLKYKKWARKAESLHKSAFKSATRVASKRVGSDASLVIHHIPFL
jgi:hypothetical protein